MLNFYEMMNLMEANGMPEDYDAIPGHEEDFAGQDEYEYRQQQQGKPPLDLIWNNMLPPKDVNFNYFALKYGYSPEEIQQYLSQVSL